MKLHIYRLTVYTGKESDGTLKKVRSETIALRNPENIERVARAIMEKHDGDEVSCVQECICSVMD